MNNCTQIIIKQGADKVVEFKHYEDAAMVVPKDLATATARFVLGTDFDTPILTLTLGGGLSFLAPNTIVLNLTPNHSNGIEFDENVLNGVWQLEVTVEGKTLRMFEGTFKLYKRID